MTERVDITYWMRDGWYEYNEEKKCIELTEKAPPKARKSFEIYKKRKAKNKKDVPSIAYVYRMTCKIAKRKLTKEEIEQLKKEGRI